MKKFIEKNKIKLISLGIVIYFILIYIFSINVNIPDVCFIGAMAIGIIVVIANIDILNEYEKNKKRRFAGNQNEEADFYCIYQSDSGKRL